MVVCLILLMHYLCSFESSYNVQYHNKMKNVPTHNLYHTGGRNNYEVTSPTHRLIQFCRSQSIMKSPLLQISMVTYPLSKRGIVHCKQLRNLWNFYFKVGHICWKLLIRYLNSHHVLRQNQEFINKIDLNFIATFWSKL